MKAKAWVTAEMRKIAPDWQVGIATAGAVYACCGLVMAFIPAAWVIAFPSGLIGLALCLPFGLNLYGSQPGTWRRWQTLSALKRLLDAGAGSPELDQAATDLEIIEAFLPDTGYDDQLMRQVRFEVNRHMNRLVDLTYLTPGALNLSGGQVLKQKRESVAWLDRLRELVEETTRVPELP